MIRSVTKAGRTTRLGSVFALAAALVVSSLMASSAVAAPKRVGVLQFRGPGEGAIRNKVTRILKSKKLLVVGGAQISKTAKSLSVRLEDNDGFSAVAKELNISAFVTGEVAKNKKKVTLTVREGADGSVAAEAAWPGANPRKIAAGVNKTFWRRLGSAIDRAKAPSGGSKKAAAVAEEEEAPESGADDGGDEDKGSSSKASSKKAVAEEDKDDDEKESKPSKSKKSEDVEETAEASSESGGGGGGGEGTYLDATIGPKAINRSLAYSQPLYDGNNPYTLPMGPAVGLEADFFPMAMSSNGPESNFGLNIGFDYMFGVTSKPSTGTGSYTTAERTWFVGAKYRLGPGYVLAGYGDQVFQLNPTGGAPVLVPAVDYRFVRVGGGVRLELAEGLFVMGGLSYLHVLSFGQISSSDFYPRTTTGGAGQVNAGLGYRITPMIEARAMVEARIYAMKFNVTRAMLDADPSIRVAGGAVDRYIAGWLGLAITYGGGGGGEHASSKASDKAGSDDEDEDDDAKSKSKKKDKDDDDDDA